MSVCISGCINCVIVIIFTVWDFFIGQSYVNQGHNLSFSMYNMFLSLESLSMSTCIHASAPVCASPPQCVDCQWCICVGPGQWAVGEAVVVMNLCRGQDVSLVPPAGSSAPAHPSSVIKDWAWHLHSSQTSVYHLPEGQVISSNGFPSLKLITLLPAF